MVGVCVVLVGIVIAFGCERSTTGGEGTTEQAEGGHMMEGEHHHDEPAEEHGEHMEEAVGEHEHGAETAVSEEGAEREPSGKLVDGVRVVDVAARQFEFEPATVVVRQGEKVRLKVTSEDVTHGIGIEGYDIDEVLPPGETKAVEFTADEAGAHHVHCTIYCGEGHNDMHGELVVLARSE